MGETSEKKSKGELKREALLHAAARVFSQKGYMETSIKNITDEASVAVGTFYTYFGTKEEVLEQIYEEIGKMSIEIAAQAAGGKDDSVVKKFTLALASAVKVCIQNEDLSKVLLLKSMGVNGAFEKKRWEILDGIHLYLKQLMLHLKEEHHIDCGDIETGSILLSQSILGMITYMLAGKIETPIEEVLIATCTYHLRALNMTYDETEIKTLINCLDLGS